LRIVIQTERQYLIRHALYETGDIVGLALRWEGMRPAFAETEFLDQSSNCR